MAGLVEGNLQCLHPEPGIEPATEWAYKACESKQAFWSLTAHNPCPSSATSFITVLVLYSPDRYLKHPIIPPIYSIIVSPLHGVLGLSFLLLYLQDLDVFLAWSRAPNKY